MTSFTIYFCSYEGLQRNESKVGCIEEISKGNSMCSKWYDRGGFKVIETVPAKSEHYDETAELITFPIPNSRLALQSFLSLKDGTCSEIPKNLGSLEKGPLNHGTMLNSFVIWWNSNVISLPEVHYFVSSTVFYFSFQADTC